MNGRIRNRRTVGRKSLRRFEALLAPRELDCLRLRMAGLRHQEIADVLGVHIGTVGAMLSRILKKTRTRSGRRRGHERR